MPSVKFNHGQETLYKYTHDPHHQNVVLKCSPLKFIQIEKTEHLEVISGKKTQNTFVFLDKINDPHNLGAILRSCFYLGVDGIILDEHKRCPLTPTVSKTSAGALELLDVFCVPSPVDFIKLIKADKWKIHAAVAMEADPSKKKPSPKKKFDKQVVRM